MKVVPDNMPGGVAVSAAGVGPGAAAVRSATAADRIAAHIPGWLLVLCGLAIVGTALLVPSWLEVRQLEWQRHVMDLQVQQLTRQAEGYQRFEEALASDDPVLLERLAFVQLRVKPVGVSPLVMPVSQRGGPTIPSPQLADLSLLDPSASIDAWLHTPLPQEGVDYMPYQPIQSRLVRLTTGISRFVLLGAGLCFIAAGLSATPLPDDSHLRPELRRAGFTSMWQKLRRR